MELDRLAKGLLEYETLDGNEVKIIEGGTLVRKDVEDEPVVTKVKRRLELVCLGRGERKSPVASQPNHYKNEKIGSCKDYSQSRTRSTPFFKPNLAKTSG